MARKAKKETAADANVVVEEDLIDMNEVQEAEEAAAAEKEARENELKEIAERADNIMGLVGETERNAGSALRGFYTDLGELMYRGRELHRTSSGKVNAKAFGDWREKAMTRYVDRNVISNAIWLHTLSEQSPAVYDLIPAEKGNPTTIKLWYEENFKTAVALAHKADDQIDIPDTEAEVTADVVPFFSETLPALAQRGLEAKGEEATLADSDALKVLEAMAASPTANLGASEQPHAFDMVAKVPAIYKALDNPYVPFPDRELSVAAVDVAKVIMGWCKPKRTGDDRNTADDVSDMNAERDELYTEIRAALNTLQEEQFDEFEKLDKAAAQAAADEAERAARRAEREAAKKK